MTGAKMAWEDLQEVINTIEFVTIGLSAITDKRMGSGDLELCRHCITAVDILSSQVETLKTISEVA